jgi:hypothetical protein
MHGARLTIRAPTENDYKKSILDSWTDNSNGILGRGWLGSGDATPHPIARPSSQDNRTISMWGRRANGYGSVIDGTDARQAMMERKGRLRGWRSNGTCVMCFSSATGIYFWSCFGIGIVMCTAIGLIMHSIHGRSEGLGGGKGGGGPVAWLVRSRAVWWDRVIVLAWGRRRGWRLGFGCEWTVG